MKNMTLVSLCLAAALCGCVGSRAESRADEVHAEAEAVRCGADRTEAYAGLLDGRRVGLVVNHTSVIAAADGTLVPLPDSLLRRGINVRCIFAPEHGYRGVAAAGEHVGNGADAETGLKIYSLYGKTRKPQPEWMAEVDVLVFDMQDVGARFYTYLSTLKNVLEACAVCGKELVVLDRPNPKDTVDGPVLRPQFASFVGCIPIPLLHGCTLGELAKMMLGEGWIPGNSKASLSSLPYSPSGSCSSKAPLLTVIPCSGWRHGEAYHVPIAPSPNLRNDHAIALYPSLCLFEGTDVSVGRGTDFPFEQYGHAKIEGEDLRGVAAPRGFSLEYILKAYGQLGAKMITSQSFFDRLAGTDELRRQIVAGKTEAEIRAGWQADLEKYRAVREKYLIYE